MMFGAMIFTLVLVGMVGFVLWKKGILKFNKRG